MIKIFFKEFHACTLTITNGTFYYDFSDDLNEDGRNIVVDTFERASRVVRLIDSFNELDTNQFEVRLDSSDWSPILYVSGIREYLCALMIMLSNAPGIIVRMNYFVDFGSEVSVRCPR